MTLNKKNLLHVPHPIHSLRKFWNNKPTGTCCLLWNIQQDEGHCREIPGCDAWKRKKKKSVVRVEVWVRRELKVWWRMRRLKECDTPSHSSPERTSPDTSSLVDKRRLLTYLIHRGHADFSLKWEVAFPREAASCCRRLHHGHENNADEPHSCRAMIRAPVITFDHTRCDNNIVVAIGGSYVKQSNDLS